MKTLVDFVTQNKGIEYLLAIAFICGYALFVEFLNPRPFRKLVSSIKDDVRYLRGEGRGNLKKLIRNILQAPFVAIAYLAALPFYMIIGIVLRTEKMLSGVMAGGSMAWRPLESYLSGHSRRIKVKDAVQAEEDDCEEGDCGDKEEG